LQTGKGWIGGKIRLLSLSVTWLWELRAIFRKKLKNLKKAIDKGWVWAYNNSQKRSESQNIKQEI
jgi:hypothetical protein